MKKAKIKITVVNRIGKCKCHRGHQIGDSFDYDTQRGEICPMAMHIAFPYIDILRYGGSLPTNKDGKNYFCCSDVDVINVFSLEITK